MPDAGEPIDLNAADLAALDSLPGVGPATARAILEERTRRGGFRPPATCFGCQVSAKAASPA